MLQHVPGTGNRCLDEARPGIAAGGPWSASFAGAGTGLPASCPPDGFDLRSAQLPPVPAFPEFAQFIRD
jgi:hypothetical protein